MSQKSMPTLRKLIDKMLLLLDNEITFVTNNRYKSIEKKKNIINIINKSASVLALLNKLNKEILFNNDEKISSQDQEILKCYIEKFNKNI